MICSRLVKFLVLTSGVAMCEELNKTNGYSETWFSTFTVTPASTSIYNKGITFKNVSSSGPHGSSSCSAAQSKGKSVLTFTVSAASDTWTGEEQTCTYTAVAPGGSPSATCTISWDDPFSGTNTFSSTCGKPFSIADAGSAHPDGHTLNRAMTISYPEPTARLLRETTPRA